MMPYNPKSEFSEMSRGSDLPHTTDTGPSSDTALGKRVMAIGQRGRQPKPNALKVLGGELRGSHLQQSEVEGHSSATKQLSKPALVTEKVPPADSLSPTLDFYRARDSPTIMDVAPFRLSKTHKRIGEIRRYPLHDGYVELSAGAYGMATVWDYDIVLMMISHLTDAMNRYRKKLGDKPREWFRVSVSEILRFTRRGDGSRQAEEVENALTRLLTTTLKRVREEGYSREAEAEGLIAKYKVESRTDTGKIQSVVIKAPEWLYNEVVHRNVPLVLAIDPEYFLITSGIARVIYRQARRAAGKSTWTLSFQLLYERSGSSGTRKKFDQNLRCLVRNDNLPRYTLTEEAGKNGPLLVMSYRRYLLSPGRKGA